MEKDYIDPYLSDLSEDSDVYSELSQDSDIEIPKPKFNKKKSTKLKLGSEPETETEDKVVDLTDKEEKREKAIRSTFEKSFKTPEEKRFNKDVQKTAEAVATAITGALHSGGGTPITTNTYRPQFNLNLPYSVPGIMPGMIPGFYPPAYWNHSNPFDRQNTLMHVAPPTTYISGSIELDYAQEYIIDYGPKQEQYLFNRRYYKNILSSKLGIDDEYTMIRHRNSSRYESVLLRKLAPVGFQKTTNCSNDSNCLQVFNIATPITINDEYQAVPSKDATLGHLKHYIISGTKIDGSSLGMQVQNVYNSHLLFYQNSNTILNTSENPNLPFMYKTFTSDDRDVRKAFLSRNKYDDPLGLAVDDTKEHSSKLIITEHSIELPKFMKSSERINGKRLLEEYGGIYTSEEWLSLIFQWAWSISHLASNNIHFTDLEGCVQVTPIQKYNFKKNSYHQKQHGGLWVYELNKTKLYIPNYGFRSIITMPDCISNNYTTSYTTTSDPRNNLKLLLNYLININAVAVNKMPSDIQGFLTTLLSDINAVIISSGTINNAKDLFFEKIFTNDYILGKYSHSDIGQLYAKGKYDNNLTLRTIPNVNEMKVGFLYPYTNVINPVRTSTGALDIIDNQLEFVLYVGSNNIIKRNNDKTCSKIIDSSLVQHVVNLPTNPDLSPFKILTNTLINIDTSILESYSW